MTEQLKWRHEVTPGNVEFEAEAVTSKGTFTELAIVDPRKYGNSIALDAVLAILAEGIADEVLKEGSDFVAARVGCDHGGSSLFASLSYRLRDQVIAAIMRKKAQEREKRARVVNLVAGLYAAAEKHVPDTGGWEVGVTTDLVEITVYDECGGAAGWGWSTLEISPETPEEVEAVVIDLAAAAATLDIFSPSPRKKA